MAARREPNRWRVVNPPPAALTDREIRGVFAAVAAGDLALAVLFALLSGEEPLVPWVSPGLFALGAAGSVLVWWRPEHRRAFVVSLVGTVCALFSRAVYVPAAWAVGSRPLQGERAVVAVLVYGGGALAISWLWLRFLQPAIEMRRERHRAGAAS